MSRKYTNEDVYNALKEVEEGASIAASARKFGVPRSTLSEKRSGRHPIECRMGPDTVLTKDEENLLEEWIFHVSDVGFPVSKRQLLDSVQMILNKCKRKTVFTNNRPGRKWYAAFRKRHPKVVERESQNLTRARASVTEEDLRKWYSEVYETLSKMEKLDILDDPNRAFNMDESGFYLSPEPGKVLARRGDRRVYSRIDGDEKECITTLIGGNASGLMTPPLVMFPYQRLPSNIVNGMPKTWAFGRTTTGWMTSESFYEYITNCFHPWLVKNQIKLPILLFVDGHASHVTFHLSDFCSLNGIILIALYPNSTHIIQPMDVSGFRPLKDSWHKAVVDWRMEENGARLTREKFPKLLKTVLDSGLKPSTIANGFVKCGLCPFNADAIDYGQLIKKGKLNENRDDDNDQFVPKESPNQFLAQFESHMDPNMLKEFKKSKPEWQGDICDVSLFKYWRTIGGSINDDETNRIQLYVNDVNDIIFEYIDATNDEFHLNANCGEVFNLDLDAITEVVLTHDEQTDYTRNDDDLRCDKLSCDTLSCDNISCDNISCDNISCDKLTCDEQTYDKLTDDERTDDEQTGDEETYEEQAYDERTDDERIYKRTNNEPDAEQINKNASVTTTVAMPSGLASVQENIVLSAVTSVNRCDASEEDTPMKQSILSVNNFGGGEPSKCFRDLLFWPGRTPTTGKPGLKRKREKVKIPSVLTSEDAMNYLKAKEAEKERLEMEKIERKNQRELKKEEKHKNEQEKSKQKEERKKQMAIKAELQEAMKQKREGEMAEKKQRIAAKKAGQEAAKKIRDNAKRRKQEQEDKFMATFQKHLLS